MMIRDSGLLFWLPCILFSEHFNVFMASFHCSLTVRDISKVQISLNRSEE